MIVERIQKIQNRKRKKLLQKQQEHILKDFFAAPLYIYTSHDSVVETSVVCDWSSSLDLDLGLLHKDARMICRWLCSRTRPPPSSSLFR